MRFVYIFDIDGTIANIEHRLPLITGENKDWDLFYQMMYNDKPICDVVQTLRRLKNTGADIIFITGRPDKYMKETEEWLRRYTEISKPMLIMRKNGDHREDYIVKKELYEKFIKPFFTIHTLGVFEDRKQCVDMWRSLGLTCYQVADGNY